MLKCASGFNHLKFVCLSSISKDWQVVCPCTYIQTENVWHSCEEPTFIYGDNQSVLANTTAPDSQLKKKSNSIAYHFVREGCARDEWRTTYVNTHDNPADLMTKPYLPAGEKRNKFVRMLLWWLGG